MSRPDEIRSVHVCVNVSCMALGSKELISALEAGLDGTAVELRTIVCFGACEHAANVVLYPRGTWYSHVELSDVDEILANIRGEIDPIKRLIVGVDPRLQEVIFQLIDSGLD